MTGISRSRPARQPNWRPGERPEVHPLRRWLIRFGWTLGALALVAFFVWLLWMPVSGDRLSFAALTIGANDPGELPPPAFAKLDRSRLASLGWNQQLALANAGEATNKLASWDKESDTFILYVSAHVALRPAEKGESQVCLLAPDFRRADLGQLFHAGDASAAINLRDLLKSLAQVKAKTKVVLLDVPRTHAEPWLSVLSGDWSETLAADVEVAADPNTWVVTSGGPEEISRIDHAAKRSQFAFAVEETLTGKRDANGDGQVDIAELKRAVSDVTGQTPLVLHKGTAANNVVLLPRPLQQLSPPPAVAEEPAPTEGDEKPKDGKEEKAPPPDPILLAWQANDALLDVDQTAKSSIGPIDYAPDLWRELQSTLIWHDWSRHTSQDKTESADSRSLLDELTAAKPAFALEPNSNWTSPKNAALTPFREAIDRFAVQQQESWEKSPPGYRFAVRRRNILLARVPEYWRWKAACGALDLGEVQADLQAVRTLCDEIARVEAAKNPAAAAELMDVAKRNPNQRNSIAELYQRVTADITDEATSLVDRGAALGKTATLDGPTQYAIEQLLLTSLPNAADRQRLWKTLETSDADASPMQRAEGTAAAQAALEATLAQFEVQLAKPLALAESERLNELSASIEEASNRVAASDAAGALDFARRLGEYQSLLVSATPMNPANGAGEVFARFADGLIPRSPGSSTLATPVTWLTKLAVDVSAPVLDLGESGTANVTITLRVEGDSKSPSLQLSSIPAPLRVEHNGKLLTAGEALSGKQFELKVSVPRGVDLPEKLELRGEGMMQANGNNVAEPVLISVTMPSASRFELQPLAQTEIVRTIRDGDRERLALLAFPKRLTNFSLGVKQVSGATGPLRAALYALNEPVPGEQLPSTFDDLQARATRLDVQVAVADQGAVRPIKFLPTAPPAAPPTTPPAPPAAPTPSGPVALPSKYLAVVLDEMEGEAVAKRHIEWLEIEPLHPNRFVETPTPQIVIGSGQRKIEVPIQAKATVEGTVAIPDEGVPFALTGSEAFADVDMTQASGSLKRARPLKPKLNLPEPDVDARGARLALAVASYPRAFMWNVDSEGGIIEPFRGARVEIRSPVEAPAGEPPLSLPPDQPIPLALEVDSDDQDCEVEVELRLLELDRDPNDFDFDPSAYTVVENVKLRGTRQVRNTLTVGETGALGITSEVGDFQFALPSTGSQGHAEIFARVVDPSGQSPELTSDRVRFVLDGAPPVVEGLANENDELLDHVIDKPLAIRIRVTDRLSGPKSLLYWLDREPQSMAGAFVPPGVEAKLEPDLSETPNFTERDFTVMIEKVPPSPPGRSTNLSLFLGATDHAGNAFTDFQRVNVRYVTRSPMDAAVKPGKPRDVIITVEYKRGTGAATSSSAEVELVAVGETPGQKKKASAGKATFPKLKPGAYQFKASGNMANAPGVGETTVVVPSEGDGPVNATITLAAPPPPPPVVAP